MYLSRVRNDSVWQSLKLLFLGALTIFLINNLFGFDNALKTAAIPRWQILIHLHAGSVGWITLSAIGIAIWVFTGDRSVDGGYESFVRRLAWAGVGIFGLYVIAFGLSYAAPASFLVYLHPLVGIGAVGLLWVATVWAFQQMRSQPVLTTVHLLSAGALLTASIGATVGMLLGLEHAIGEFLPLPPAPDRVGAHAGMMDTYLFLVASCVIEWATRPAKAQRWTWPGLAQAVLWMVAAVMVPIAFFLNAVGQILPIFGLLLLIGMVIFLARYAWRALTNMPTGAGIRSWAFFGALWLVVYMALFLWAVSTGGDFAAMPGWFFPVFAHAGFVGMMTNLLLGVAASRAQNSAGVLPWGEPAAMWTINLGLLVFFGLKIAADMRLGALVMGVGVVLGVVTMLLRLRGAERAAAMTSGAD